MRSDSPWGAADFLAEAALEGAAPGALAAGLDAAGLGADGAASAGTELPQPILSEGSSDEEPAWSFVKKPKKL